MNTQQPHDPAVEPNLPPENLGAPEGAQPVDDSKLAPDTKRMKEKLGRSAASAKERGAEMARSARDKYDEVSRAAAHRLHEGADQLRYRTQDFSNKVRSSYDERSEQVRDSFDRHPLAYAAGAFAVGFLIGLALPKSRREDRLIGKQTDRIYRKGAELKQQAKEASREAMQTFEDKVKG